MFTTVDLLTELLRRSECLYQQSVTAFIWDSGVRPSILHMKIDDTPTVRRLTLHWPLVVAGFVWILLFAGFLHSEPIRGLLAIGCTLLIVRHWRWYRRSGTGRRLAYLSAICGGFILAFLWLGLNVVRFYTYDPESVHTWAVHIFVADVQDVLAIPIAGLVVIVFVWSLAYFAHWLVETCGLRSRSH